jgi:predicted PolB exonuclease-like 3'-5' exonuclease
VQNDRLVTFNGLDFDLPFLMVRSAILGVKNPWGGTLVQRYKTQYHFDVRAVLTQWSSRGKGTLAEWLDAFGLAGKTGSGADVYPLVQQGRITEVAQYAAADAARTLLLYELVAPVFE